MPGEKVDLAYDPERLGRRGSVAWVRYHGPDFAVRGNPFEERDRLR